MKPWRADHPVQLVLGLSVWALWFCVVYGAVSLACGTAVAAEAGAGGEAVFAARNAAVVPTLWALGGFTVVTALALSWAAWRCWRATPTLPERRFIARGAALLHAVAAISTLFVGLPMLWVPACT